MDCLHVLTAESGVRCPAIGLFRGDPKRFDPEEELIGESPSPPPARRSLGQPLNCFRIGFLAGGSQPQQVLAGLPTRSIGSVPSGLMFPKRSHSHPVHSGEEPRLVNSLSGVILPPIAFGLPTTIMILVPFLQAIPREIEEAAVIDRCSRLGFFSRVLPLSVPGVISTGILAFIGSWNCYLLPLFILNSQGRVHSAPGDADFRVAVPGRHRKGARLHLVVNDPGVVVRHPDPTAHPRWATGAAKS
jgi:hypothetical protein